MGKSSKKRLMTNDLKQVQVWDTFVRFFHWSIALLFILDYWFIEGGEDLHDWIGYGVMALLVMRLFWGVIGSQTARFRQFFPTKASLALYLKHFPNYDKPGHNPLGALMVFALLFLLALTAISGWMRGWSIFWGEDWIQMLHEYAADALMAMVFIHVIGVLVMQRLSKRRLVKAMVTGKY